MTMVRNTFLCCTLIVSSGFAYATETISIAPGENWNCTSAGTQWSCQEAESPLSIYDTSLSASQYQYALLNSLGWISDSSDTDPANCSLCGGHYVEPIFLNQGPLKKLNEAPAEGTYKHATYKLNGEVTLQGPVEISQPDRTLFVRDTATLYPNPKTGKLEKVAAQGDLKMHQPGQLFLAQDGTMNLFAHQATFDNVTYLMRVQSQWSAAGQVPTQAPTAEERKNFTGYAHGHAEQVVQTDQDHYVLHHTTYSTCAPDTSTWQLNATEITLDKLSGEGVAYNTLLLIHGLPVFYLPYFNFPLNHNRKSGFLYPMASSSGSNGYAITVPYYFNLAPNYDDTLTPTFYTKRGTLIDNEFRYLNTWFNGTLDTQYLPHDNLNGMNNRYEINTEDTAYWQNWTANLDYTHVSDQNFIQDIQGGTDAFAANQVLLNQQFTLNYNSLHWQFTGLLQQYQIINDQLTLANQPYRRLPELDLSAEYPTLASPFAASFTSQFVNFQKNVFQGPPAQTPVNAQRSNVAPTLSLPLVQPYGFFTPTLTLQDTNYNLEHGEINGFPQDNINRTLPIFNIDTGLYLDRNFDFGESNYTQTIEPRLYYLLVPNTNQNNIPIFDTSIPNFTYDSLFQNNRFTGIDRIGDANQLSYSLSTSFNNEEGQTFFSTGAGQILYFRNRDVQLCQLSPSNPSCLPNDQNPYYTSFTSEYAGYANIYLGSNWSLNNNLTYSHLTQEITNQSYIFQYKTDPQHIFNIGYQNILNDYALMSNEQLIQGAEAPVVSQLTASFIWGLTPKWGTFGALNYAFNNAQVVNEFAGLQYSSCCWTVEFAYSRFLVDNNPNDPSSLSGSYATATMLQFSLKGLGSTNNDQIESLEEQIPGYDPQHSGLN